MRPLFALLLAASSALAGPAFDRSTPVVGDDAVTPFFRGCGLRLKLLEEEYRRVGDFPHPDDDMYRQYQLMRRSKYESRF